MYRLGKDHGFSASGSSAEPQLLRPKTKVNTKCVLPYVRAKSPFGAGQREELLWSTSSADEHGPVAPCPVTHPPVALAPLSHFAAVALGRTRLNPSIKWMVWANVIRVTHQGEIGPLETTRSPALPLRWCEFSSLPGKVRSGGPHAGRTADGPQQEDRGPSGPAERGPPRGRSGPSG